MLTTDKISEFRALNEPIISLWSIGDEQIYGSLLWRNGHPYLSLIIELSKQEQFDIEEPDHPIFHLSKPPLQPNIFGYAQGFGSISLLNCARFKLRVTHNPRNNSEIFILDFQPTEIWMGSKFDKSNTDIVIISLGDRRLTGIFGDPGLETLEPYKEENKEIFSALNNPNKIWVLRELASSNIRLGKTEFTCDVGSNIISNFSATRGVSATSCLDLNIRSENTSNWNGISNIVNRFEQLVSIISLEPFSFEFEMIYFKNQLPVGLVWRFGEDRTKFKPPMKHQTIVDLSNPVIFEFVCSKWFAPSEIEQLSRWIFVRALRETDDGLARFVSVSQALEVLGREYGSKEKLPKSTIREAVRRIRESLELDFEKSFVDRIAGLIGSSNKSSYRDVLTHMITQAAAANLPQMLPQVPDFCKTVAETRNAVVHMTDDSDGKLSDAFSKVNKLSLLLCFWYTVIEINNLGIDMPNIMGFLFNNRNARHGLPNDVLERSKKPKI